MQELTLRVVGNVSQNHAGKQESIDEKVIVSTWRYLDSQHEAERLNVSLVLMACTIHLNGKQQAVWEEDADKNPVILQKMVERL